MKYPQSHSAAGGSFKIAFILLAGVAASLLLSMTMASLVVKWLAHS